MTSLRLEPGDRLRFSRATTSRVLRLTNTGGAYVAFKVKTTVLKAYAVRPSSGTLAPGAHQDVCINLNSTSDPAQVQTHRFLVVAIPVKSADALSREEWEAVDKSSIQEQRLGVVWEERQEEEPARTGYEANAAPAVVTGLGGIAEEAAPGQPVQDEAEMVARYNEVYRYKRDVENTCQKLDEELTGLRNRRDLRGASGAVGDGRFSCGVLLMALIVAISAYVYALPATG